MPKRKLTVPSSGSTTQRSPLVPPTSPSSSPRIPSPGRAAESRSRISASASWSASETRSVGDDLALTTRSVRANASRSWAPVPRAFELRGDGEDEVLAIRRGDELHGEREAVAGEAGGHGGGGLARVVVLRRPRHEPAL